MNKNQPLSQDRSFSFSLRIGASSLNINIQFIPSMEGSSPNIQVRPFEITTKDPPVQQVVTLWLRWWPSFQGITVDREIALSYLTSHQVTFRRLFPNNLFAVLSEGVDCEQSSCVKIISIRLPRTLNGDNNALFIGDICTIFTFSFLFFFFFNTNYKISIKKRILTLCQNSSTGS